MFFPLWVRKWQRGSFVSSLFIGHQEKPWNTQYTEQLMRKGLICNNTCSRYAYGAASGHIYYQLHYSTTEGNHKSSYRHRWPNNQRRQHKQYRTPFPVAVIITQTIWEYIKQNSKCSYRYTIVILKLAQKCNFIYRKWLIQAEATCIDIKVQLHLKNHLWK